MSRTVPSFAEEGLKRFLHGMDRRIKDLERGGDWRFDTEVTTGSVAIRNQAHLLVLTVAADPIASGADYVQWAEITAQHGFATVASAAEGWTHPTNGVYVLTYTHTWDTYEAGGTVQFELDGITWSLLSGTVGQHGVATLHYAATADSVGKIKVVQSSGVSQSCTATVQISLPDPDTVATAGAWELEFAADLWGVAWDGTSWWTTAPTSLTISQRDTAGTVVSSFATGAPFAGELRGITWDGTSLWVTGGGASNEPIANYSTAGTLLSSFNTGPVTDGNNGLAWDGSQLWLYENNGDDFERWTTAGSMSSTFTPPGLTYGDIAYWGSHLWAVDLDASTIVKLTTSGTQVDTIDLSGLPSTPRGLWIMSDGTLYASGPDGLYRWQGTL